MQPTTENVLRRSAGPSLLFGLVFVVTLPLFCLLGVPTAVILTKLVGRQLDAVTLQHRTDHPNRGFFAFYAVLVLSILAAVGGTAVATALVPAAHQLALTGIGGSAGVVLALALALPYAFTPLVARDAALPSAIGGQAFLIATRAMTRVSLRRRLGLVALPTLAFMGPLLLYLGFERDRSLTLALVAAGISLALLLPLASAFYVASYGQVREALRAEPLEGDPVALPAIVRITGASALLAGVALLLLLVASVVIPLPMHQGEPIRDDTHFKVTEQVLPGTDVIVRPAGGGVTVAARDGGGVGHVSAGCREVESVGVEQVGEGRFRIEALCRSPASAVMTVDGGGVRLDDGLRDRLATRTGPCLFLMLGLAALLWIYTLGGPWRALERVRALRSLASSDDPHAQGEELRALEGTLRTDGRVELGGSGFRALGGAQVVGSGTLRVALPESGPALGSDQEVLLDGASVAVVGRFERGVGAGLREGAAQWPDQGLLVPGGRRAAAEHLTLKASRRLAGLLAALTLAQGIGILALALAIV